ncbi:unnamed protein product [Urochloa humidicola]
MFLQQPHSSSEDEPGNSSQGRGLAGEDEEHDFEEEEAVLPPPQHASEEGEDFLPPQHASEEGDNVLHQQHAAEEEEYVIHPHQDVPMVNNNSSPAASEPDTFTLLTEPTKCSLMDTNGFRMELATATVYPKESVCHTVTVDHEYAGVKPTYVYANATHIELPIPVGGDEIRNLGEALLQRIQWPKKHILIPPRSRAPNSAAQSGATGSDAEEDSKAAGSACVGLHAYYMEHSVQGKTGIPVQVARSYFRSDGDLEWTFQFSDLYDLFNNGGLDVCLLRCWTLKMMELAEEKKVNVGFLDPVVFTATILANQSALLRAAICSAMKHDFMFGAYNTGGHWILVIIAINWNVVLYLDSAKIHPLRKFPDVQHIVNWAFGDFIGKRKKTRSTATPPPLTHKTNVACARQPSGTDMCGFYVARNMMDTIKSLSIMNKAADFKPALTIDRAALMDVQEMLSAFILKDIINPEGKFYCVPQEDDA